MDTGQTDTNTKLLCLLSDLWIGILAKCVVYGIGNYARFAAKISHTDCFLKYQKQIYGTETVIDQSNFGMLNDLERFNFH